MIKKERKPPLELFQLEAALRRIPVIYAKREVLESKYRRRKAGYTGELQLDYELSFLRNHEFFILNDLRLPHQGKHFQMDSLLLSTFFFLKLEAKHLSGKILIDHHLNQMTRTLNSREEGYSCPVQQVKRHELQLKEWLAITKNAPVPMQSLVVFTNPNSILTVSSGHPGKNIIIKNQILTEKIANLQKIYQTPNYTKKDLSKISRQLIKQHSPRSENILNKFKIPPQDMLTGVFCPRCNHLPMVRLHGKWQCTKMACGHISKDAHLSALRDYALIFGSSITNAQCRKFLHIPSRSVTQKLLASMELPSIGTTRSHVYQLPLEE